MLSADTVLAIGLAYVALLFLIAFVSDWRAKSGHESIISSPVVYTLSISVYCTSWTFYGAVGFAARSGLEFVTIYLGPTLVFIGWWFFLRKLVRIRQVHRITSIADLISSRYGKSTSLGMLVTIIAVVGTIPYIGLQLQAVSTSFIVVSNPEDIARTVGSSDALYRTGFWVAAAMAVFTILFGTRKVGSDERNHGVVAAIAFEAVVKLVALVAVGLFVVFSVSGGLQDLFSRPLTQALLQREETLGTRWVTLTILAACAIICLPRQFHVTVVENADERHLRTASWLFPLYLFLISLFVLPIAVAGLTVMPEGSDPDMFVLTLPIFEGAEGLALLAFIGGFSSATSMVIVATIALSIMVSNHIVLPLALRLTSAAHSQSGDVRELLMVSRRISIAAILFLGFLYFRLTKPEALASIGLIAFTGVAQFLPAIVGGLFWRQGTGRGAAAGLIAGFVIWGWCLFLPGFSTGAQLAHLLAQGPWGIAWLRPQALFGLEGFDPLVHAVFWSLSINAACYIFFSLIKDAHPLDRLQSALFVDVYRNQSSVAGAQKRFAATEDLFVLAQRILGRDEAFSLFRIAAARQGTSDGMPIADSEFITHLERRLANSIGAATAHAMVSQVVIGEPISLQEVIKVVDETHQVIVYSQQLERQSRQLRETAEQLQRANEQLKRLDKQKDDFLSHVSHEVRTPMTSIRSFAEILLDNRDIPAEQRDRFLSIIHSETLRLTDLLDEILDLSHLERGEARWTLETLRPEDLLSRALDTCRGMAALHEVSVETSLEAPQAQIAGVADRLHQVFINLLTNAIKYNTNPKRRMRIRSFIEGQNYCCEIEDNGPGIPAEDRSRIFEKYSRGWDQPNIQGGGTGLGLAISRHIVENLKGQLRLAEVAEGGACFRVTLPLAIAQDARSPSAARYAEPN